MGFYAPAQLVRDAREHGVDVSPVDVNFSNWDCTLEANTNPGVTTSSKHNDEQVSLRLGLRLLRGFSQEHAISIETARAATGPFRSFDDFSRRTQLGRTTLQLLSRADAFASLDVNRRDALWKSMPVQQDMPLFKDFSGPVVDEADPHLPQMTGQEDVVQDYTTAGLSLKKHPVSFLREQLTQLRAISAAELAEHTPDRRVKVAGLVLMRQRPQTANGITFMTLEDETGIANLVVYPNVWTRFRATARFASVLMASGRLQREGDIIHIVCDRLDDVSEMLDKLDSRARNFR